MEMRNKYTIEYVDSQLELLRSSIKANHCFPAGFYMQIIHDVYPNAKLMNRVQGTCGSILSNFSNDDFHESIVAAFKNINTELNKTLWKSEDIVWDNFKTKAFVKTPKKKFTEQIQNEPFNKPIAVKNSNSSNSRYDLVEFPRRVLYANLPTSYTFVCISSRLNSAKTVGLCIGKFGTDDKRNFEIPVKNLSNVRLNIFDVELFSVLFALQRCYSDNLCVYSKSLKIATILKETFVRSPIKYMIENTYMSSICAPCDKAIVEIATHILVAGIYSFRVEPSDCIQTPYEKATYELMESHADRYIYNTNDMDVGVDNIRYIDHYLDIGRPK